MTKDVFHQFYERGLKAGSTLIWQEIEHAPKDLIPEFPFELDLWDGDLRRARCFWDGDEWVDGDDFTVSNPTHFILIPKKK